MMTVHRENSQSAMPDMEAIVICKVVRVNPRFAAVNIMVVNGIPCSDDFQGVIRVQDVRATEKDKVKIYNSFRPGDIVRAQVVSLLPPTPAFFFSFCYYNVVLRARTGCV